MGNTAFIYALQYGNEDAALILCEQMSLEEINNLKCTIIPLIYAAKYSPSVTLKLMLRMSDEAISFIPRDGRTALMEALANKETPVEVIVSLLLRTTIEATSAIDKRTRETALSIALVRDDIGISLIRTLMNRMSDEAVSSINTNITAPTALLSLIDKGYIEDTCMLIPCMSDAAINTYEKLFKYTALMKAAAKGYTDVVRTLLPRMSEGAIHTKCGFIESAALHFAKLGGYNEIVKLIEERLKELKGL